MPFDFAPSFGSLLKRYRRAAGLTQEELAQRAGFNPNYISMLERGVRPASPSTAELLAEILALEGDDQRMLQETATSNEAAVPRHVEGVPPSKRPGSVLPAESTSLVGRERDEAQAVHLLRSDATRLLTLTGPGGVGKTRLALRVAATLEREFEHGAIFVPLGPIREHALVVSAIVQALGLRDGGHLSLQETVINYLQDREMLLLLDNFEHVLDAAPVVSDLLAACPHLKVLVTGRASLRLQGEQELDILPLALPDRAEQLPADALLRSPAVALFVQRAQAIKPDFQLADDLAPFVAEICRRLDGLPLAIELAAARIRMFSPLALLGRLENRLELLTGGPRDAPARQQTLRQTIDWSHDLLAPEEQTLFARLSVFAGGCTLEAVETVCHADGEQDTSLLDGVSALMDHSLVVTREQEDGEPRVGMLETIREYAAERLEERGEADALRRQHALYYLSLAEAGGADLPAAEETAWLNRLTPEIDNVRVALQWTRESGEVEIGLRLASTLPRFWGARASITEGRRWMDELLRLQGNETQSVSPSLRARAMLAASDLAWAQGDLERVAALSGDALALSQEGQESAQRTLAAEALRLLGQSLGRRGDHGQAMAMLEQSLVLAREMGDTRLLADILLDLTIASRFLGKWAQSRACYKESLELLEHGAYLQGRLRDSRAFSRNLRIILMLGLDRADYERIKARLEASLNRQQTSDAGRVVADVLDILASLAREQGDYNRARAMHQQSLALSRELGERSGIAAALLGLSDVAHDQGDAERQRELCEESLAVSRALGAPARIAWGLHGLGLVAQTRGDTSRAQALLEESLALLRTIRWNFYGGVLVSLGSVALDRGDLGQANAWFAESLGLSRIIGPRWTVAMTLEGLGSVALREGQPDRAARILGAADALRSQLGTPIRPVDRAFRERDLEAVRSALGEERFAQAWNEGSAWPTEQAIDYALDPRQTPRASARPSPHPSQM